MREVERGHPSIRIHLFGEFIVERLVSSPASVPRYEQVPHEEWRSRGPAMALLKALVCHSRRRASRDTLIDLLWPPNENGESDHAFDSAVSILRKVLRTQQGESLLTKVRSGGITIYALPNQWHIWVDADAFEHDIDQAMKAERCGDDALPLWEAAYKMITGAFLEDDLYSGWAEARRHILDAARHRCLHRLVDLYLAQNLDDQAETLLQEVVLDDPTDEDALCRLLRLLERQERYQEGFHLYQQSVRVLDEEYHKEPLPRTIALAERLRSGPITVPIKQIPPTITHFPFPSFMSASQTQSDNSDMFFDTSASTLDQPDSAWLALGVSGLGHLLDVGWSCETLLETLNLLLTSRQNMPPFSRRAFLHIGTAVLMRRSISIPTKKHVSAEEHIRLAHAFGQSIAAGWKLFHTAGNAQVLAVGQVQLSLLEQASASLPPPLQSMFYSGVYRLIGAALHFQGEYAAAFHFHERAYLAALEGADVWNMAQSRSWQAYGWQALGRYDDALQATDAALRLITHSSEMEHLRLRARLLAFGAENASFRGDGHEAQTRLNTSETLLAHLPTLHEEFDRLSWLQASGLCAFNLGQPTLAIQHLQKALHELPIQWVYRYISTALPLARAYAAIYEREATLGVAQQLVPLLEALQAKTLLLAFERYLHEDVLTHFPHDSHCQAFVVEARHHLALHPS